MTMSEVNKVEIGKAKGSGQTFGLSNFPIKTVLTESNVLEGVQKFFLDLNLCSIPEVIRRSWCPMVAMLWNCVPRCGSG